MFIARRELTFARGRFALVGSVIALMSLLVVALSGLTAGLANESISAIRGLPGHQLVFVPPPAGEGLTFTSSQFTANQAHRWTEVSGQAARPLGVATTRISGGEHTRSVTAFGVDPSSPLAPAGLRNGAVVVSPALTDQWAIGDQVDVGGARFAVTAVGQAASFNHTPVVWIPIDDWRRLDGAAGAFATVLVVPPGLSADSVAAADAAAGTQTVSRDDAFAAVGSFSAENGSLTMIRMLLLGVGGLVVGAFFAVWTVQRTPELAVLKAMGASNGYLLRDALAQALAVMVIGGGVGALAAVGLGRLVQDSVPVVMAADTVLVPLALLVLVGLLGAAAAVRRITTVDPLTALGAAR